MTNWKDAYKDQWKASNKKENDVKKSLSKLLNCEVQEYGLGAGSTEYILKENEPDTHKAGDPDLYIPEYDAYVEVTGPNVKMYYEDTLWIRPDKITNCKDKLAIGDGKTHFIVHVLSLKEANTTIFRIISIDKEFIRRIEEGDFKLIHPRIRGKEETYYEIPYNDRSVYDYYNFVDDLIKA